MPSPISVPLCLPQLPLPFPPETPSNTSLSLSLSLQFCWSRWFMRSKLDKFTPNAGLEMTCQSLWSIWIWFRVPFWSIEELGKCGIANCDERQMAGHLCRIGPDVSDRELIMQWVIQTSSLFIVKWDYRLVHWNFRSKLFFGYKIHSLNWRMNVLAHSNSCSVDWVLI